MKLIKLYAILSLMFAFSLSGQIVIDWDEIPHQVGTQLIKNSKDSVTVNLGTTGGPQTWNFTSQPMGSEYSYLTLVEPASTPYIDSFPGANVVYCSPAGSDTVFQYYKLNSDFLVMMGLGGVSPLLNFLWKYDPSDSLPCPQTYGSSGRFKYGYTEMIDTATDSYMTYLHYGTYDFNAYGTVTIPSLGSFDCLRECAYDTCVMILHFFSIPTIFDTTTFITYGFVAEDRSAVACVKSYPEETNPNFINALSLERLTFFSSGIEDNEIPTDNIKCEHYPKLFSGYTTIQYSLPEESHVELTLYDINGRIVKTLVNDTQTKGNYSYRWYGENYSGKLLSSGIYFYRLKAGKNTYADKVILMR
jgi:hypothetical protein